MANIKIGNIDSSFKVGVNNCSIYLGGTKLYPQGYDLCYAVVDDISEYQGSFDDVYETSTDKWYKRNNLNQYEEYGLYGNGRNISTYYGKLTVDGGHEYEWNGSSWTDLGATTEGKITVKSPQYIEKTSANNGMIDLGVVLKDNTKFQLNFKPTSQGGGGIIGEFGSPGDDDDYRMFFTGNQIYYDYGDKRLNTTKYINKVYNYEIGNYYIKDMTTSANVFTGATQSGVATAHTRNIYLGLGISDYWWAYYLKVYEGEILIRDFIPWTDTLGNYGLFDKVSKQVFESTGTLTASSVVNDVEVDSGEVIYPKYYATKADPLDNLTFNTLADAEAYALYNCVYDGMKATIGGSRYVFDSVNGWTESSSQEPCFAVVDDIGLYGDTDYIDVYNKDDSKWYKLNNLDSYEEYGIYETGNSLSEFTYYDGKLVAIGEDEYQYNDNDWELVGEYITGGGETTYEIVQGDEYRYQGELFSTTFKIPIQDVQGNYGNIDIRASYGNLNISLNGWTLEASSYELRIGQNTYTGIVTSDTDYLYFSMDNDEVRSIIIDSITPIYGATFHIIGSGNDVSYDINSNISSDYDGYAMLTNFKIPYLDVQMSSNVNFEIEDRVNNKVLSVNIDEITQEYTYGDLYGGNTYTGTVTYDGEYYYFEPPVEAPSAITIGNVTVNNGDAHIIFGGGENIISVEYPVKEAPENNVSFDTMEDALDYECPWVGMTAVIDNVAYIFSDSFEWITKFDYVVVAGQYICSNGNKYEKLEQKIRNTDGTWSSQSPAVYRQGALIEADSPDCLGCTINFCGENSTGGTISIDNGTTTLPRNAASGAINGEVGSATQTIGAYCFAGSGLTSLTIANTVTTIEHEAFNGTYGLTTLTIPASVTQIDFWAFTRCTGLTEVIFEGTTPPTFTNQHSGVFHDYCPPVIYVPDESVEAYRAIDGSVWTNQTWSTNIIQPISLR